MQSCRPLPDWLRLATSRVQVDVKYADSKEWQPMPSFKLDPDLNKPFTDWANTALEKVRVIRIVLRVPAREAGK